MTGGYTEVFGGQVIYPSQTTFLELTLTADVTLTWPIEQQIGGNTVADVINVSTSTPGLTVTMPDASTTSKGIQCMFVNKGAQTVTIEDADGNTIISLGTGEAWIIYLTDNTTTAGTWSTFQLGATVTAANASALAGAGLKAISATLNQRMVASSTGTTPVNVVDADRAEAIIYTGGVGVANLPTPVSVGSDWFFYLRNDGSGTLTVTPAAGNIDGSSTLALAPAQSCIIFTDGTNYYTVGLSNTAVTFDFIEIDLAGLSGTYTLSTAQQDKISYRFIGALAGNISIVVPSTIQEYWIDNQATGFTLDVGTSGQVSPVTVTSGSTVICSCDSSDVINAATGATVSFPITIAQGGTGQTTASAALTALGGVPTTRNLTAGSGLSGGGTLASDRSFAVDINGLTAEATVDGANDYLMMYDASAAALRKVLPNNVIGQVTSLYIGGIIAASAVATGLDIYDTSGDDPILRLMQDDLATINLTISAPVGGNIDIYTPINNGDITLSADDAAGAKKTLLRGDSNDYLELYYHGLLAARTEITGFAVFDTAGDDPLLRFVQDDGTTEVGQIYGNTLGGTFNVQSSINSQNFSIRMMNSGGSTRYVFISDPDDKTIYYHPATNEIVFRTTSIANGSLEVYNTTAAAWERALTESDWSRTTGTFSPIITGYGTPPTPTIAYEIFQDVNGNGFVTLTISAGSAQATSNATTLTWTAGDIPAAARPAATRTLPTTLIDNGSRQPASLEVSASGNLSFTVFDGTSLNPSGFTASGTKGLESSWTITYQL